MIGKSSMVYALLLLTEDLFLKMKQKNYPIKKAITSGFKWQPYAMDY